MSLSDWRTYQSVVSSQESVTVPSWKGASGEYPEPNFGFLKSIYEDPLVGANINFIVKRALGEGYHFECMAPDAPNYMKDECTDYLKDWFEAVRWGDDHTERGFDELANSTIQELGWAGTSLLELLDPDDITALAPVPITSIWKWHRDTGGQNVSIHQFPQVNTAPLTPSRYLTYKWNTVDRSPWGHGLTYSLSRPHTGPRGEHLPPLILMWWQMLYDAWRRLHRYAGPHAIYGAPGIDQTTAKAMSEALQDPDAGASFLTNAPVSVAMDTPTARGNFQAEFDLLKDAIITAIYGMMSTMISSDKGFSFASSTNGFTAVDIIVWDLQKNFKRTNDYGLVIPVAAQAGFDVQLLKPAFVFNIPDKPQEYNVVDIPKYVEDRIITPQEARKVVKMLADWPIEAALPPELQPPPQMPMGMSPQGQPMPGQQPQQQQRAIDPRMARLAQAHGSNGNGQSSGR